MKRHFDFLLLFISCIVFLSCHKPEETYESLHEEQFKKAMEMKTEYEAVLKEQNVSDPEFYISIVFPELERYDFVKDKAEVMLDKITPGNVSRMSDCSIGRCQMKPSFAREVESLVRQDPALCEKYSSLTSGMEQQDYNTSRTRIARLLKNEYQMLYLQAFSDICEFKYALQNESVEEKLKVISAAYNAGLADQLSDYDAYYEKKCFPCGKYSPFSKWNYSDLVVHYYMLFAKKNPEN